MNNIKNINLRKKIRKRMLDLNVKVIDLAKELNISVAYASNYLTGYITNEKIEKRMFEWYEANKPRRKKKKEIDYAKSIL